MCLLRKKKVVHTRGFRNVAARKSREFFLHHNHGTEERSIVGTDLSFGQVAQNYFPAVHRLAEIKTRPRLTDHRAKEGIGEECATLV